MKKIYLSLSFLFVGGALVYGQTAKQQTGPQLIGNGAHFKATMKSGVPVQNPDKPFSLTKSANPTVSEPQNRGSRSVMAEETVGRTTFDLATNSSMYHRIVNNNGKLSVVWTFSSEETDSFPVRGTAYNYFDGTNWVNMPAYDDLGQISKIEPEGARTGWGSILNIPGQGEVIIGHRTDIKALHMITNTSEGSQDWTNTAIREIPYSWPRMANGGPNGKTIHLFGIATEDTIDGVDVFDGMYSALLYCRSLDGGNTWDKMHVLLPGMDSTKFSGFSGDSYSIDVRGNTVALVYGDLTTPVVVFKSTDNGETWTNTMVRDFPFVPWKDQLTDFNNDGDTDDEVLVISMDTVYAQNGTKPDYVVINGSNLNIQTEGNRKFVVSGNDTLDVENDLYVVVEHTETVNDTFYIQEGTYVVFPPADTASVQDDNGYKFVMSGSDTLAVQNDTFVVRQSALLVSDTSYVVPGEAYKFITVAPGETKEVIANGGREYIILNGDTLDLLENAYVLLPGDTTIMNERIATNDGTNEIYIDANNKVHVWYGNMTMSNDEVGDDAYTYYPGTYGIMYWNEDFAAGEEPRMLAGLVDINADNTLDILLRYDQLDGGGNPNITPGPFPYGGGGGSTTTPTLAVDASGKMYLFYQAFVEGEQYYYIAANGSYGPSFRHIYVITSTDNGQTWSSEGVDKYPTDLTVSEEAGFDAFTEYAFPSAARVADDFIHLTYISDESPGIFMNVLDINYHPINNNRVVYLRLTPQLNVGVQEVLQSGPSLLVYPNPAQDLVQVGLNLDKTENVQLSVSNMLGQVVLAPGAFTLPAGKGSIQVNTSSLPEGIYLVNVKAGQKSYSSKVIINR